MRVCLPHYFSIAGVKQAGIAFITVPNEMAETDYWCDGGKRKQPTSLLPDCAFCMKVCMCLCVCGG